MLPICLPALCLLLSLLACTPSPASPRPENDKLAAAPLRLELIPFTDPRATLLALDQDGRLRVVRFYPSRQVLAGATERVLSAAERQAVGRALEAPDPRQAIRVRGPAGNGPVHGDLYRLALPAGEPHGIWGVVEAAPPALREFIDTLLRLDTPSQRMRPVPLAGAYVRASRVEPARAADLKATTPIRIVPLSDCSPELRSRLEQTLRDPLSFHPLPPANHAELTAWRSLGDDVFVSASEAGIWQLSLYSVE